jgi:hypothetical protein
LSFLLIKKAYSIIPDIFHKVYLNAIELGHQPTIWRESIRVIIKKFNKSDYSDPKSYRIISLLNCLGKITEKIMAERLSHVAETTDLLYHNQIGGRKQRSAIDAAMSLLSYIEINKQRKKLTSCLFLDIKGAYDHVNKSQLLDTCSQYLPSIYCQWISSFLSNRKHKLAFDGEIIHEFVDIDVGIP